MASLLFSNNHRLKLVDDEDNGGPTESSFRTDWSSILKPNRRPVESRRLSKEDSMTSFDADSLFSSAEGSGEQDSLAPQASIIPRGGTAGAAKGEGGGSRRALHLPPSYSNGRATPDTAMALAPSVPTRRSKSLVVDGSLDSMLPTLPSTNKKLHTGSTTTTTNSSSSFQEPNRKVVGSFGSDFFPRASDVGKGGVHGGGEWTSHTVKSEASLSFFDPNASRESFFLDDDHTAEEQDEIDNSERHTIRPLFNGFPSSARSIPLEGSFSAFSLEPDDEEEADELISPCTPATNGTSTSHSKPKLGLVRHDMPTVRWRTADFGVEDFQVTTPSSRSDRSRSRRSLPSSIFQSASMVEHDTPSSTPNRSLRGYRRTSVKASSKLNDLGKSPRLSVTAIDLTKADEVAREKSNNLKAHRSTIRAKSMQRSSNRSKICKDREALEGRLNDILGSHGDHAGDELGFPAMATPEGSHRSRRSSSGTSTKKQESSRKSSLREMSSSNDFDFDDVDFPRSGCPTSESLNKSQFPDSESSRRTRTLDKKVTKEKRDKNAIAIESIRVNERPSLSKNSETNKSKRSLKDNTTTPNKTTAPTVEEDGNNSSRRTRTSSPRKSKVISETQRDNSKMQTRGEGTLQAEFPLTKQTSKKGLNIDGISGLDSAHVQGHSESIWDKIEKEKERKQKIRDHIQFIQNDNSHLVSPPPSHNEATFADFENSFKSITASLAIEPEDPFNVDCNTTFFDDVPKKQGALRELAKVEPKIIRASLGPSIPSRLKEAPVQKKDESLDLSGHTNYTRSANWNWEEDHWDESKGRLSHPSTIQEGDENADDAFASPIVQGRKSLNANATKSSDFLSPIVHKKKIVSATTGPKQAKLNDFFESTNTDASRSMEGFKTDRSVASAPSMDPFPIRELHRTTSMGRPPRPLVPERQQLRRSDPTPRALTETSTPSTRRQKQPQQQQRSTVQETPSPRAVKDLVDQENVPQKTAARSGVVKRSSGSARRDTHEQRKGAVRDAIFNLLNAED